MVKAQVGSHHRSHRTHPSCFWERREFTGHCLTCKANNVTSGRLHMGTDSLSRRQTVHSWEWVRQYRVVEWIKDGNARPKSAFVGADRLVIVLNMAWRNDASFKNRTETSSSLNRRNKRCKMCRFIFQYMDTENNPRRKCQFSLYGALTTPKSSFTANLVVDFSEVLHRLCYASTATIVLFGAVLPAWSQHRHPSPVGIQCWRKLRTQGYQSTPRRYNHLAMDFGSSVVSPTNHLWNRELPERGWKREVPVFVNEWRRGDEENFGNSKICNEVGLFLDTLNVCREENIFYYSFCMRHSLHRVFNDHHIFSALFKKSWIPDRLTLSRSRKFEIQFFWRRFGHHHFSSKIMPYGHTVLYSTFTVRWNTKRTSH